MKLVLIQHDFMAQYEGRKQMSVVKVDNWKFDVPECVELFRTEGAKAFE